MRSPNGSFPEYHTSADDLSFVRPEHLAGSLDLLTQIIDLAEQDRALLNTEPYGEPQLGSRGLFRPIGGASHGAEGEGGFDHITLLWVLNLSDGQHSLLDIAERSGQDLRRLPRRQRRWARRGCCGRRDARQARPAVPPRGRSMAGGASISPGAASGA